MSVVCSKCKSRTVPGKFEQEGFKPIRAFRCPVCRHVDFLPEDILKSGSLSEDFFRSFIQSIDAEKIGSYWMHTIELLRGLIPYLTNDQEATLRDAVCSWLDIDEVNNESLVNIIGILFNADDSIPIAELANFLIEQFENIDRSIDTLLTILEKVDGNRNEKTTKPGIQERYEKVGPSFFNLETFPDFLKLPPKIQDELEGLVEYSRYWIYDDELKEQIQGGALGSQLSIIRAVKKSIAEHIASLMSDVDFCFLKEYVRSYPEKIASGGPEILDYHIAEEYVLFVLEKDPDDYDIQSDDEMALYYLMRNSFYEFPEMIRDCDYVSGGSICTIRDYFIDEFKEILREGKIDPTKLTDERRQKIEMQKRLIRSSDERE